MKADLEGLRREADSVVQLPKKARQTVEDYLHIQVQGVAVACPYHINPGLRATSRALLGKGAPAEIVATASKYFALYDMHVDGDKDRLRAFLQACGIGIDCSGFVSWVLNAITEETLGGPLSHYLRFPGLRRSVVARIRPIENASARLLTSSANAVPLGNLADVKPGDLIRAAARHHVLIVSEVGRDAKGRAIYFQYAQSSCMYGEANGVRTGFARVTKPHGTLLDQQWFDDYPTSIIRTLLHEGEDSCLVRLKALR